MSIIPSNTSCSSSSSSTDFDVYPDCRVSPATARIMDCTTVALSAAVLAVMLGMWTIWWRRFLAKPLIARLLLLGAPGAVSLFILRPLLGIALPDIKGTTNVGILFLVNVAMLYAGNLGVLFIYMQARLLESAVFGQGGGTSSTSDMTIGAAISRHARALAIAIAIIQSVVFIVGTFAGVTPRYFYFGALLFIDLTCIPLFSAICLRLYQHIRQDKEMRHRHAALARQILIVTLGCIGSAVGTVVGSVLGCLDVWPFIASIVPLTAVLFFLFMFTLLARKPRRRVVPTSVVVASASSKKTSSTSKSNASKSGVAAASLSSHSSSHSQ